MPKINGVPTFVKWAGGKTQLLSQFKPIFPRKFKGYIEPFVGSSAVFFFIKKEFNPEKIVVSDTNEELINAYLVVQNNLEELLGLLKVYKENHSKEYYYGVRALDVVKMSPVERAARFLYLNKTCFNGLYRINSKGQFNVPFGKYKNPNIVNEKTLREANKLLQGVTIKLQSFEKSVDDVDEGDFVYFDPPYHPLSKTANFTSYTKKTFLEEDQRDLALVFEKINQKGVKIMLSNSDTEFVRSLYSNNMFKIQTVKARRVINCNASKRGKINELVVMNY
ncbi:modification methylase DpnIIA [archaeon]|nr:modification methylase DpnIIA [archaeon]